MNQDEPQLGVIYYIGQFPGQKPRLIKIYQIYYDPSYFSKVMRYRDNNDEHHTDRLVFSKYYRKATSEEILLYWKD